MRRVANQSAQRERLGERRNLQSCIKMAEWHFPSMNTPNVIDVASLHKSNHSHRPSLMQPITPQYVSPQRKTLHIPHLVKTIRHCKAELSPHHSNRTNQTKALDGTKKPGEIPRARTPTVRGDQRTFFSQPSHRRLAAYRNSTKNSNRMLIPRNFPRSPRRCRAKSIIGNERYDSHDTHTRRTTAEDGSAQGTTVWCIHLVPKYSNAVDRSGSSVSVLCLPPSRLYHYWNS